MIFKIYRPFTNIGEFESNIWKVVINNYFSENFLSSESYLIAICFLYVNNKLRMTALKRIDFMKLIIKLFVRLFLQISAMQSIQSYQMLQINDETNFNIDFLIRTNDQSLNLLL